MERKAGNLILNSSFIPGNNQGLDPLMPQDIIIKLTAWLTESPTSSLSFLSHVKWQHVTSINPRFYMFRVKWWDKPGSMISKKIKQAEVWYKRRANMLFIAIQAFFVSVTAYNVFLFFYFKLFCFFIFRIIVDLQLFCAIILDYYSCSFCKKHIYF